MSSSRRGLGKGLGALIPTGAPPSILSDKTRAEAGGGPAAPDVSRETGADVSRETSLATAPPRTALGTLPIDTDYRSSEDTETASYSATVPAPASSREDTVAVNLPDGLMPVPGASFAEIPQSQIRPNPPETTTLPEPIESTSTRGVRRRMLPQLLAAAAAVVLLAAGVLTWHPWQHDGDNSADLATQILNAPDAMRVTEKLPGGTGELTLVRSASLKRAVMIGDHVPAAGSGKTYQMWYQQPGQPMVSAGLMPDADEPTVLTGDAATAVAAAVSVEPAGGSHEPTTDPVALFPLKADGSGNEGA